MIERALTQIGDRFGDRVVIAFATDPQRGRQALVACGCGSMKLVLLADLRAGRSDRCRPCRDKRNGTRMRARLSHATTLQTVWCPDCGNSHKPRVTHATTVQTVRCRNCGHVFNHKPKEHTSA